MKKSHAIAVLDDDTEFQDELCDTLAGAGHNAIGLADAASFGERPFDTLILDLAMPGIDGIDVLRRVAKQAVAPSIILVSGFGESVLRTATRIAETAGLRVLGALTKPIDSDLLFEMISKEIVRQTSNASYKVRGLTAYPDHVFNEDTLPVHFQPKVRVSDLSFAGAEALLAGTWGGIRIPPPLIVDAARALPAGLIRLTQAVLRQAIEAARCWTEAGYQGSVSVNLPLEAILNPSLLDQLQEIVLEAHIAPNQITFELLEDALYDTSADVLGALTKLRLAGFGLSLDDLGQRQSGLLQLANLPVTEIKIDIDIVRQTRTWEKARVIFESLAALGQRLGVSVTAEGVETEADLLFVRQHPVDYVQGYLISRKCSLEELLKWLEACP